jgi:hypothetical protein
VPAGHKVTGLNYFGVEVFVLYVFAILVLGRWGRSFEREISALGGHENLRTTRSYFAQRPSYHALGSLAAIVDCGIDMVDAKL